MNPLYNQLMGQNAPPQKPVQQPMSGAPQFTNPMQKINYILQAMRNPVQFVRNAIPDLPESIANDPNQILQYLKQTRGITDQQIQMAAGQIPRF